MYRILCFGFSILLFAPLFGQGNVYTAKGGLSVGVQSWDGVQRQPLFSYHGALSMEGFKEGSNSSLFAQVGLHNRGSSERIFFLNGSSATAVRQSFQFTNAAVLFGARRRISESSSKNAFYTFAARMEYTLGTNLDESASFAGYFPIEPFVNKFNYGATVSFGYEFPFSEFVGGVIEASISPDLSFQYEQLGRIEVFSPITGQPITLPEQQIRNITFEISVGFRFLHKVIYIDDY